MYGLDESLGGQVIGIRDTEKASSLILTPQLHCILHTTDPDDGVAAAARAVLPFCQLVGNKNKI